MDSKFRKYIEVLAPKFAKLLAMEPVTVPTLPRSMPDRGVYLFSERDIHLYVGRADNVRDRIQSHCRPSSSQGKAAFAFRLAREATGKTTATYGKIGSRIELEADPMFAAAFKSAKERIRSMNVRFVEENDSVGQYLLEVYVAIVLGTPHNDFDNH